MIRGANRFCVRLWRDESGVVLAITVVVFLTLFMIACGVYAVGEIVRERIEIQNAADSAAYSAAVVQADAISRIAAINRAMAWTYGQMVRMELDYVVDKWLELAVKKFWEDYMEAYMFNRSGTCNFGDPRFFWAGISQGENKEIRLNANHQEFVMGIEAARTSAAGSSPGKSWYALAPRISDCRNNIRDMNAAEKSIIGLFPKKITKVVEDVLSANIRDLDNDRFSPAGSADIKYKLFPDESAHKGYFEIEKDENKFLWLIDWYRHDLGHGTEDAGWFKLDKGAKGIKRGYARSHDILRAEWRWWSSKWQKTKTGCVLIDTDRDSRYGAGFKAIMGDDGEIYSADYYNTEVAQSHKLKEEYFEKDGTIVVGVARRMNNPWQFVVSGRAPGDRGIFSMATLDADKRFMWGAASARASYKLRNSPRDKIGWFETTFWDIPPQNKRFWNLKWSDWDAVLLPLRRAWAGGNDGVWNGAITGGEILADLGGGGWKPVPPNGSGGNLGVQKGPSLMGGGNVNYGGADKLILH
ncbi:MAG: hypothetical protein KAH23_00155 [Kiritimatiellae bacterium]|nr:hypothetical protein [Kiritimatiellia bacterium]